MQRSKLVVYGGLLAATYCVLTVGLAPISYAAIQFRVSELLKPLALFHPGFAIAFGIGNFLSNLFSPFGAWDYLVMPLVDTAAALICYQLRRWRWMALITQAIIISAGVAFFPLGLGAGLPFWVTFPGVILSESVLLLTGYAVIWRKYGDHLLR